MTLGQSGGSKPSDEHVPNYVETPVPIYVEAPVRTEHGIQSPRADCHARPSANGFAAATRDQFEERGPRHGSRRSPGAPPIAAGDPKTDARESRKRQRAPVDCAVELGIAADDHDRERKLPAIDLVRSAPGARCPGGRWARPRIRTLCGDLIKKLGDALVNLYASVLIANAARFGPARPAGIHDEQGFGHAPSPGPERPWGSADAPEVLRQSAGGEGNAPYEEVPYRGDVSYMR